MTKTLIVILSIGFFSVSQSAGQPAPMDSLMSIERIFQSRLSEIDSSVLFQVTFPADSDTFAIDSVRYGAWSRDTCATIRVEGKKVHIYRSGGFSGSFLLKPGWNRFTIQCESTLGTQERMFHLYRIPPLEELSEQPTQILDTLMVPSVTPVYYTPQELRLQFVGSPGGKAYFKTKRLTFREYPMIELPPERTGGRRGVYRGVYIPDDVDDIDVLNIHFYLKGTDGKTERKKCPVPITLYNLHQPVPVITREDLNLIFYSPWGEIYMELPPGIVLEVLADTGSWYKVRISDLRTGYILKSSALQLEPGMDIPEARLYNIESETDSNWVTFKFNMSEKVPFRLVQSISPQQISVFLYRTVFQDEWTVYPPFPDSLINHISWDQVDNDIIRFDINLSTSQQWGFRGWYEDQRFNLAIRKPPVIEYDRPLENLIVALDAGHGGEHKGAVGASGVMEKDINLVYAFHLKQLLENAGARVVMTRTEDSTMSLQSRVEIARDNNAHILVWLHNNSTGWTRHPLEISGTSTYYTHLQGWPFARYCYRNLLKLNLEPFGEVHRTYYVTRQNDMVVYLVEGAFLSHPMDELFLMNDKNLENLASAVYQGLAYYLRTLATGQNP